MGSSGRRGNLLAFGSVIPNWQVLAFAAALANVFYGLIVQRYGELIGNPQTMAKGTEEIKKGIQTILIVLFLIIFITAIYGGFDRIPMPGWLIKLNLGGAVAFNPASVLSSLPEGCSGSVFTTVYCNPIGHARVWIAIQKQILVVVYGFLDLLSFVLGFFNTLQIEAGVNLIVKAEVSVTPFHGLLDEPLNYIHQLMSDAASSFALLDFQDSLLDIAAYAMEVFFPIGIVFRSFPPTRLLGAFLMSLGLVLYLVFPLSFYFLDLMMEKPFKDLETLSTSLVSGDTFLTLMTGGLSGNIDATKVPPELNYTGMAEDVKSIGDNVKSTVETTIEVIQLLKFASEVFPLFSLVLCAICLFSFTKALS